MASIVQVCLRRSCDHDWRARSSDWKKIILYIRPLIGGETSKTSGLPSGPCWQNILLRKGMKQDTKDRYMLYLESPCLGQSHVILVHRLGQNYLHLRTFYAAACKKQNSHLCHNDNDKAFFAFASIYVKPICRVIIIMKQSLVLSCLQIRKILIKWSRHNLLTMLLPAKSK